MKKLSKEYLKNHLPTLYKTMKDFNSNDNNTVELVFIEDNGVITPKLERKEKALEK